MRLAFGIIAIAAACGTKHDDRAAPAQRSSDAQAVTASPPPADAAPVAPDAGPAAPTWTIGAPVDLATLPQLAPVTGTGTVEVHAADVDLGVLRTAVARAAESNLVAVSTTGQRISGRLGPGALRGLTAALQGGALGPPSPAMRGRGGRDAVDLWFYGADHTDLFRVLASVTHSSVVVATPGLGSIDIRAHEVSARQLIDVLAERLGQTVTRHGNLAWIAAPGSPPLDPALLATRRPIVAQLSVRDARASDLYALLASLGVTVGGAPCDGPRLTFQLRDVPAGAALAVIAALSGQPPTAGVACGDVAQPIRGRDLALRAIARIGARRAATLVDGDRALVGEIGASVGDGRVGSIGDTYVTLTPNDAGADELALQMYPPLAGPMLEPVHLAEPGRWPQLEEALRDGRLAATIVGGRSPTAIFALPDARWTVIDPATSPLGAARDAVTIGPGTVSFRHPTDDLSAEPVVEAAVLRAAQ